MPSVRKGLRMAIKLDKSMLAKNLVLNHKLVQHIDRVLGEGDSTWSAKFEPKVGDDAWHPSGDCVPSPYVLYHKALDALAGTQVAPHPASLQKTFTVGHFWHHYLQHIIVERLGFAKPEAIEVRGKREWGPKVEKRYFSDVHDPVWCTESKPFHWATGSADIAPCSIPVHGDYLVDIKTMGAHDFKPPRLPAWCAEKYECQLNIYMDWFDLDQAIILAVCKDSPHDFKEFHFERNQPLIDAIYFKWQLVSDCLDQGVEPDFAYNVALPIKGPS